LRASADFVASPEHIDAVAEVLAQSTYLDCPAPIIARTLRGELMLDHAGRMRRDAGFVRFVGREITRPDVAKADWLYSEMVAAGQIVGSEDAARRARAVFDADFYDRALTI
jgi:two-component system, oxyanion-binding sensor